MLKMSWIKNKTITYDLDNLPFDKDGNLTIKDISKVALNLSGFTYPVDIGSFCYVDRYKPDKNTTNSNCATVLISPISFRKQRIAFIKNYISFLSNQIKIGKSKNSLKTAFSQFSRFVNWCDKFEPAALDGKKQFSLAYEKFSDYLYDKVKSSQININTASSLQLIITTVGTGIYGDPYGDLFLGAKRFKRSYAATNVTEPPDEKSAAFAFELYKTLFNDLSDFTVHKKPFPHLFQLHEESFWIFPLPEPFVNALPHKHRNYHAKRYWAYDFENGVLRNMSQVRDLLISRGIHPSDLKVRDCIQRAENVINYANFCGGHKTRKLLASMAAQAFIMMFSSATGMNLSQIASIPWTKDEVEISNKIQGFKAVKARSGNRTTTFHLSQDFVKHFKRYLDLRKTILAMYDIDNYDLLFFGAGIEIKELGTNFSSNFNARLRHNFNIDIKINTRMWRAYKSDWLVRNKDITTTALILQNSAQTVLKHYSAGSETTANLEMTEFFSTYYKNIVISKSTKSKTIAMGQCTNIEKPKPLHTSTIPVNCSTPEGCLYCENYRVHADELDVRKLFSCQYLLNSSRTLLDSNAQFEDIYLPIIKRIDIAIEKIESSGKIKKEVVEKIKSSVFNYEQLDPYWMEKLKMLENLGVI